MNFLGRFFARAKAPEPVVYEAYSDYKIEYYPATGRYFAYVQGAPLRRFDTGRVMRELTLYHATSCTSENEALRLIKDHYEQAHPFEQPVRPTPPPLRYIREDGKVVK